MYPFLIYGSRKFVPATFYFANGNKLFETFILRRNQEMKPVLCEKKTYTVAEITKILGISKTAAYALIKENKSLYMEVGKSIRINKESFDKWFYSEK